MKNCIQRHEKCRVGLRKKKQRKKSKGTHSSHRPEMMGRDYYHRLKRQREKVLTTEDLSR